MTKALRGTQKRREGASDVKRVPHYFQVTAGHWNSLLNEVKLPGLFLKTDYNCGLHSEMESKLEHLPPKTSKATGPKEEVADSWEDDALSDCSPEDEREQEQEQETRKGAAKATEPPHQTPRPKAPPPTPVAPPTNTPGWDSQGGSDFREERRRPEKSTAVASRLIAGALGVKAPKKTEEQRAYERSVKEQEIRRRNREKEQREKERLDGEKAKASVWDG